MFGEALWLNWGTDASHSAQQKNLPFFPSHNGQISMQYMLHVKKKIDRLWEDFGNEKNSKPDLTHKETLNMYIYWYLAYPKSFMD